MCFRKVPSGRRSWCKRDVAAAVTVPWIPWYGP